MPRREDLLAKARNNPAGLRFSELCGLAECCGWVLARSKGSHRMYKKVGDIKLMDFQEAENGKAKPYQVGQFLAAIESQPAEGEQ
ncbi:MAG: hypothetical protein P4L36_20590 [Holophaga sp.]|nr:hypothetical protein [Holophaga sp.]